MAHAAGYESGRVIGGAYRLDALIGRGGFGQVFRATDLRLNRAVALKLLDSRHLEHVGLARFLREAELARALQHPNTVRLYDFAAEPDGPPYIVFELLSGESLASLLKREHALTEDRVARITVQILKSLMEAHGHGIVHRDIKPANVFICEFAGERDFVKLLDFGIAKRVSDVRGLTAYDQVIGTPRYMAPEQLAGQLPAPASDLYAVGLLMAEMLAGSPVFQGGAADVQLQQLADAPVALSEPVLRSRLALVIRRATEKKLDQRYSSAAWMLSDLEALSRAGPEPETLHALTVVRTPRWAWFAVGMALLGTALTAAALAVLLLRSPSAEIAAPVDAQAAPIVKIDLGRVRPVLTARGWNVEREGSTGTGNWHATARKAGLSAIVNIQDYPSERAAQTMAEVSSAQWAVARSEKRVIMVIVRGEAQVSTDMPASKALLAAIVQ